MNDRKRTSERWGEGEKKRGGSAEEVEGGP